MPYLNWSKQDTGAPTTPVVAETSQHPRYETQLTLKLSTESLAILQGELQTVFSEPGSELRLELPMRWTLYWKLRDGDSRLLLAHPDHESWVGSVSLNEMHSKSLLETLRALTPGQSYRFTDLREQGSWSTVGNLEILLAVV